MSVSQNLLFKVAKVYEAAEAVEDMKPKEVYESHKKCAPGEFNMHKEGGFMQKLKTLAEKQAGPVSEYLSGFNPLNWYGGSLAGGGIALATPTRSLKEQAEFDADDNALRALTNVLVPGVGPYRGFKRIGAAIRSPEMKDIKMQRTRDKAKRDLAALEAARGKEAGWKTEALGSIINPINVFGGNHLGALLAATTPTRTLNEQSSADDSTWSNLFIPGQAQYNYWKRIGSATRSPEMKAMRNKVKLDRLRQQAGEPEKAPAQEQEEATATPARKAASARSFGALMAQNMFKKQSAGPGFTASGAPTAGWANKGYNPHQAINTPQPQQPMDNVMNADRARFQFATANNPQARIDAQTAFTQAARAANSANVAVGGKPVYSPTQQPMD